MKRRKESARLIRLLKEVEKERARLSELAKARSAAPKSTEITLSVIARRVKQLRVASDLTQADLAIAVGLERTSIVNIERGHQRPTLHVVYLLADFFGISVYDMLPPSIVCVAIDEKA